MTDRDTLGRAVRDAWVARRMVKYPGSFDAQYQPWEAMTEFDRETDRQIAEAVLARSGVLELLREIERDGVMKYSPPDFGVTVVECLFCGLRWYEGERPTHGHACPVVQAIKMLEDRP